MSASKSGFLVDLVSAWNASGSYGSDRCCGKRAARWCAVPQSSNSQGNRSRSAQHAIGRGPNFGYRFAQVNGARRGGATLEVSQHSRRLALSPVFDRRSVRRPFHAFGCRRLRRSFHVWPSTGWWRNELSAMTLRVTGLPSDMEQAFSVNLHSYEVPGHGRNRGYTFHAPLAHPTIPDDLSAVRLDSSRS